jgi:hypothetical protein
MNYILNCPVLACSAPAFVICPCFTCCCDERDSTMNVELQLQCIECLGYFSFQYPCFGTLCSRFCVSTINLCNIAVQYTIKIFYVFYQITYGVFDCHGRKYGQPYSNTDCCVETTCCLATCGLVLDSFLFPMYCSYCVFSQCCCKAEEYRGTYASKSSMIQSVKSRYSNFDFNGDDKRESLLKKDRPRPSDLTGSRRSDISGIHRPSESSLVPTPDTSTHDDKVNLLDKNGNE